MIIITPRKKVLPSNYLLGNNYSYSTYLLVNNYFFPEISTPPPPPHLLKKFILCYFHIEILPRVSFLPGSIIFLGNVHSLVKPLYWNKLKQPLKDVPLNRCS